MSFEGKVLTGEATTDEEWTEYLLKAHSLAPSMSPHAFSQHHVSGSNINSYQRLANCLDPYAGKYISLVDLACGDGHLIQYCLEKLGTASSIVGIDMSSEELAIAKETYSRNKNVSFQETKAQEISLAPNSVDAILCHMAFMLMMPIEPVIDRIQRILKSGGIFSAVIGNPAATRGNCKTFQEVIQNFFHSQFPQMSRPRTGDPRANSDSGIAELFDKRSGFAGVELIEDFNLEVKLPPKEIWSYWKDTYLIGLLPAEQKQRLKSTLEREAEKIKSTNETVCFDLPLKFFTVRK